MGIVKQKYWDRHVALVNEYHDDAFQQKVIWLRTFKKYGRFADDNETKQEEIEILGLLNYNNFRSWPINKDEIVGQVDNESNMLYLNMAYLRGLDDGAYVNAEGQFRFDPGTDKFKINGVTYSPKGDSQAAQAKDVVLFHFIILKREEQETGKSIY